MSLVKSHLAGRKVSQSLEIYESYALVRCQDWLSVILDYLLTLNLPFKETDHVTQQVRVRKKCVSVSITLMRYPSVLIRLKKPPHASVKTF